MDQRQQGWARRPMRLATAIAVAAAVAVPLAGAPAAAAPVPGTTNTYTTDAQFDQGVLTSVNHDAPNNNQLQLTKSSTFFPFVNIAASARGTAIKIDVNTGATVGEYLTAPNGRARNPSRTTVDKLGNVWVANRDENGGGRGSVARMGVVTGGTRANADGSANPVGDYLKGPFAYNTCTDRNGDSLLKTSRGLGDIRPWTNAGAADDNGGVSTADDECIINYTRVTGTLTRTVAVDPTTNDVWVGGLGDLDHEKLSGATGSPVPGTQFNLGCGGYGGLVDTAGTLWSARGGSGLLRFVTSSLSGACLGFSRGDYGLGLDPVTGEIWHTFLFGNRVAKLDAAGNLIAIYPHGNDSAQGVAVDGSGNVWVAHSLFGATTVGHLRTDGTYVGNVTLPGGNGPTGVAVDANGKVWVANINSNNAMRIDPAAGPVGGGGFTVGAVDLTVDLGAGAGPYNYSDMTGAVLGTITAPVGTWSVVQDGGAAGTNWGKVTWNTEPQGSVPAGTSLTFKARAANTEAGLTAQSFVAVSNGTGFSLTGRYIEVEAMFTANGAGDSPILSDVKIEATPVLSINDVSVVEGDAGTINATFTVTMTPASSVAVTVDYATAPNTATTPADFVSGAGTVTFAPGETAKPVVVAVKGDLVDEPNETYFVNLANATNAVIVDSQGLGTIVDDDRNGAFSCRASALRLLAIEPAVANPGNAPCVDDTETEVNASLAAGLVNVTSRTLSATTNQTPDNLESSAPAATDNAVATATIERATVSAGLGLVNITATGLQAQATVRCTASGGGLTPTLTSASTIASLTINGLAVNLNGNANIQLPLGLGSVQLNQAVTTATSVTRSAVRIMLLGQEIVLAEARANFSGNPCAQ